MNDDSSTQREREIFLEALKRAGKEEQVAYLDGACGSDADLRARVEGLLRNVPEDSFLEAPAAGQVETLMDETPLSETSGVIIGRYKLLEKLGEGGFGTVWAAEQREPVKRRVALKIIKLGMDTKQVVARFEAERQALALMDHPNIAKVLDAGATDTGRPYFVMELVKGISMTSYCSQEMMTSHARLDLFIKVCQALQHAHQKGIIHRDIKPSNILITLHDGVPVPKVIDFGIAKATQQELTEKTIYTQFQQFIGTPAYMSPEQAEMSGLDIDTRSDIYSLGVLLYELLTGSTPFDAGELMQSGIDEMRKIIREQDPIRPSTKLSQTLAATDGGARTKVRLPDGAIDEDLDWIVMKCLEKDRARRYDTANGLAADLNRYLCHEPVTARPPSAIYKFQKAWRRNKVVYTAGMAALLALVMGLSFAALGWRRATIDRELAVVAKAAEQDERIKAQASEARAVAARKDTRLRAYAAEVAIASQALKENNLSRTRELLDLQHPQNGEEDLRGFEWRYLKGLSQGDEIATFPEPANGNNVAFSPNGRLLAYSGSSNIFVCDVSSRSLVTTLPMLRGAATLEFSPDGEWLASGRVSNVTIWNTLTWREERSLANTRYPTVFSPDGKWLVTGFESGYRVWDTETWTPLGECEGRPFMSWHSRNAVAFSPDGKLLFTLVGNESDGISAKIWKLPLLEAVAKIDSVPLLASAAFLHGGERLLIGMGDGALRVCDLATMEITEIVEHTAWITDIGVSGDGKTFVTSSSDRTLVVWDADTLKVRARLRGHVGEVWSLSLSNDGHLLASGSADGTCKLWDVSTKPPSSVVDGRSIGIVDQHRVLVSTESDGLKMWSMESGDIESAIPLIGVEESESDLNIPVAVHSGGALVALGFNANVELLDLKTGKRQGLLSSFEGEPNAVVFSSDGRLVAASSKTGLVKVWDVDSQIEIAQLSSGKRQAFALAFSPDSKRLASFQRPSLVNVWNLADRSVELELHTNGDVNSLAFSPDGQLLTAAVVQSNESMIWEIPSGNRFATLRGHVQGVAAVAFSPDGRTLATGSHDRLVKLWNLATQQEVATFPVDGMVQFLEFSGDGRVLVGSYFREGRSCTKLWRAPSWEEHAAGENEM